MEIKADREVRVGISVGLVDGGLVFRVRQVGNCIELEWVFAYNASNFFCGKSLGRRSHIVARD